MSEYCHHCGTTISEDIATLCPLCASKPATLRREEIDEFAAKLTSGSLPVYMVDGKPMYSGLNGAALSDTYDRSIPFSDPRCYKSRRYFPKQNDQRARSYQETAQTELFPPMGAR